MTPTEIAAMQADREAGTKGPWDVHPNCDGHMGRLDVVGPTLTCRGFTIATNVDARKAARINSDANRIARVPDMEAQIIADAAYIAELEARVKELEEALASVINAACLFVDKPVVADTGILISAVNKMRLAVPIARRALNKEKADE